MHQQVLDFKVIETIQGIHKTQFLNCMKLADSGTGVRMSFNVEWLEDGITRIKL